MGKNHVEIKRRHSVLKLRIFVQSRLKTGAWRRARVSPQVTVLPPGEWDPAIRIEPPSSLPSQVPSRYHIIV